MVTKAIQLLLIALFASILPVRTADTLTLHDEQIRGKYRFVSPQAECTINGLGPGTFSPDSKQIAAGGDSFVRVWDVQSGARTYTFPIEPAKPGVIANALFSPNNGNLLVATDTNGVLWELKTGKKTHTFNSYGQFGRWVNFPADGKYIMSQLLNNGIAVNLWDTRSGQLFRAFSDPVADPRYSAAISSDGKYIVIPANDTHLTVWDTENGLQQFRLNEPVQEAIFTPDSKSVVYRGFGEGPNVGLVFRDVQTGKQFKILDTDAGGELMFSPNGKYLLMNENSTLEIWDVESGNSILIHLTLNGLATANFSLDSNSIFTVDSGDFGTSQIKQYFREWDVSTGKLLHSFVFNDVASDADRMTYYTISPDNQYLLTDDGTRHVFELWDTSSGQMIRTLC